MKKKSTPISSLPSDMGVLQSGSDSSLFLRRLFKIGVLFITGLASHSSLLLRHGGLLFSFVFFKGERLCDTGWFSLTIVCCSQDGSSGESRGTAKSSLSSFSLCFFTSTLAPPEIGLMSVDSLLGDVSDDMLCLFCLLMLKSFSHGTLFHSFPSGFTSTFSSAFFSCFTLRKLSYCFRASSHSCTRSRLGGFLQGRRMTFLSPGEVCSLVVSELPARSTWQDDVMVAAGWVMAQKTVLQKCRPSKDSSPLNSASSFTSLVATSNL